MGARGVQPISLKMWIIKITGPNNHPVSACFRYCLACSRLPIHGASTDDSRGDGTVSIFRPVTPRDLWSVRLFPAPVVLSSSVFIVVVVGVFVGVVADTF